MTQQMLSQGPRRIARWDAYRHALFRAGIARFWRWVRGRAPARLLDGTWPWRRGGRARCDRCAAGFGPHDDGVGVLGARVDTRILLVAASGLMVATGLAFAVLDTYAVVLLIALMGTINPSAGSVSVFVPLEHAALTRVASDQNRSKIFARYSLIGALAAAVGSLAAASPEKLAEFSMAPMSLLR